MDSQKLDFYKFVATQAGRDAILAKAREYSKKHGAAWLKRFKADLPLAAPIVDLVASYDADIAFYKLKELVDKEIESFLSSWFEREAAKYLVNYTLDSNRAQILQFHAAFRAEIDRKQF